MTKASAAPRVVLKPAAVTMAKARPTLPSAVCATHVSVKESAMLHVAVGKKVFGRAQG